MVEGGRSGGDDAHGRAETNEPTRIETRRLHRMPEFICGRNDEFRKLGSACDSMPQDNRPLLCGGHAIIGSSTGVRAFFRSGPSVPQPMHAILDCNPRLHLAVRVRKCASDMLV